MCMDIHYNYGGITYVRLHLPQLQRNIALKVNLCNSVNIFDCLSVRLFVCFGSDR